MTSVKMFNVNGKNAFGNFIFKIVMYTCDLYIFSSKVIIKLFILI